MSAKTSSGKLFLTSDGTKIWYNQIAPSNRASSNRAGKSKRPMVFIHGLTGAASAWEMIYPHFLKAGHTILLVDLRGHGFSDKPNKSGSYRLIRVAEDVHELLSHLKLDRPILVGHCYGGIVSMKLAASYPHEFTGLILVNSSDNVMRGIRKSITAKVAYLLSTFGTIADPLLGFGQKEQLDYSKYAKTSDISLPRQYQDFRITSFGVFKSAYGDIMGKPLTHELKKIKCPTLIIAGEKDGFFSKRTPKEMARLIKGSALVDIPANHISVISSPILIIEKIDGFLSRKPFFNNLNKAK